MAAYRQEEAAHRQQTDGVEDASGQICGTRASQSQRSKDGSTTAEVVRVLHDGTTVWVRP
jgi:hypothetical protein